MKLRHILLAITILMLCGCGNPQAFERPGLLLFVDTTLSLNSDQSGGTAELAKKLLDGNRDYNRVAVFPIGTAGEAPVPVFDEAVKERVSERRRQLQEWDMLLDATFRKYKGNAQTCLLNSVEFASRQLAASHAFNDSPVDLVFITDMIEDCPSTPFGGPVGLEKPKIKREIDQARQFPEGKIKLLNAHVFMVTPAGYDPGSRGPRIEDLEQFWRIFFSRCRSDRATPELMISRSTLPPGLENN